MIRKIALAFLSAVLAAGVIWLSGCCTASDITVIFNNQNGASGLSAAENTGKGAPKNEQESATLAENRQKSGQPSRSDHSLHEHSFGEYAVVKEPDCIHSGIMEAQCECGETTEKEIAALGHVFELNRTEGLDVYYKCRRCGYEIKKANIPGKNKSIDDLDITVEDVHIYDGEVFIPAVTIMDGEEDVTKSSNIVYGKSTSEIGVYFLTIYMKGFYNGSRSYEYRIIPAVPVLHLKEEGQNECVVCWKNDGISDKYIVEYDTTEDFTSPEKLELDSDRGACRITGLKDETRYYIRLMCEKDSSVGDKTISFRSEYSNVITFGCPRIEVIDGATYIRGVLVVNKTYSLPSDYDPGLDKETQRAFNEMAADAKNDGIYLWITSGYRSYGTQYSTYNYFVYERGKEEADRVSARPGHSEHQSGLACDINTTSSAFAGTPEAEWIEANCWKYGFIVRYPEGKEDITGYKYEPWHVRYLGRELAKKVYDSGLCLEEYLGITSSYEDQGIKGQ